MFPIGDEGTPPQRGFPIVNVTLIAINILVFFLQMAVGLDTSVMAYGTIPYEITHGVDLTGNFGGLPQQMINLPVQVTLITSMFMHGGWLHIGGNMLYLWIFGDNVEDAMGHVRFVIFYLLCGIGAAALQVAINQNATTPMVGASGAISGVLAAYLLMFPRQRVRVLVFLGIFVTVISLPALLVIGFWIVLQFISSAGSLGPQTAQTDGVAYFAHIGGFLTGAALAFLFRNDRALARRQAMRRVS